MGAWFAAVARGAHADMMSAKARVPLNRALKWRNIRYTLIFGLVVWAVANVFVHRH